MLMHMHTANLEQLTSSVTIEESTIREPTGG